MTEHEHRESTTCRCYILALEPNEDCPLHGWPYGTPRCEVCGQFFQPKVTK